MKGYQNSFLFNPSSRLSGEGLEVWRILTVLCALVWWFAHGDVLGPGALETWDESRFPHCIEAIRSFENGELWRGARFMVSGTQGRPGACLAWAPHMFLHEISRTSGASQTTATQLALAGNLLWVVVLIASLFELAVKAIKTTPSMASLACMIFLGFFSSSINVKHFYPYDSSLAISLASLALAFRLRERNTVQAFALGIGASFAFTVYPGYYFVYPILGTASVHSELRGKGPLGVSVFWFIAGALVPLIGFEALAQMGDISFAASLLYLSGTVYIGSYEEMFVFPLSYATNVEGLLGYLSLVAIVAAIAKTLARRAMPEGRDHRPFSTRHPWSIGSTLLAVVFLAFVFHTTTGYYLHLFVWYRRLLHLFLPWVALLIAQMISSLPRKHARVMVGVMAVLLVTGINNHIHSLKEVAYPREILSRIGVTSVRVNPSLEPSDLGCWKTTVEWRYERNNVSIDPDLHKGLVLRNFCSGFMPDDTPKPRPSGLASQGSVLFSARHYETILAYQYDGMTRELRDRVRHLSPRIEVRAVAGYSRELKDSPRGASS